MSLSLLFVTTVELYFFLNGLRFVEFLLSRGRVALLDRFLSSMGSGSILLLLATTIHIYRYFLIEVSQTVVL